MAAVASRAPSSGAGPGDVKVADAKLPDRSAGAAVADSKDVASSVDAHAAMVAASVAAPAAASAAAAAADAKAAPHASAATEEQQNRRVVAFTQYSIAKNVYWMLSGLRHTLDVGEVKGETSPYVSVLLGREKMLHLTRYGRALVKLMETTEWTDDNKLAPAPLMSSMSIAEYSLVSLWLNDDSVDQIVRVKQERATLLNTDAARAAFTQALVAGVNVKAHRAYCDENLAKQDVNVVNNAYAATYVLIDTIERGVVDVDDINKRVNLLDVDYHLFLAAIAGRLSGDKAGMERLVLWDAVLAAHAPRGSLPNAPPTTEEVNTTVMESVAFPARSLIDRHNTHNVRDVRPTPHVIAMAFKDDPAARKFFSGLPVDPRIAKLKVPELVVAAAVPEKRPLPAAVPEKQPLPLVTAHDGSATADSKNPVHDILYEQFNINIKEFSSKEVWNNGVHPGFVEMLAALIDNADRRTDERETLECIRWLVTDPRAVRDWAERKDPLALKLLEVTKRTDVVVNPWQTMRRDKPLLRGALFAAARLLTIKDPNATDGNLDEAVFALCNMLQTFNKRQVYMVEIMYTLPMFRVYVSVLDKENMFNNTALAESSSGAVISEDNAGTLFSGTHFVYVESGPTGTFGTGGMANRACVIRMRRMLGIYTNESDAIQNVFVIEGDGKQYLASKMQMLNMIHSGNFDVAIAFADKTVNEINLATLLASQGYAVNDDPRNTVTASGSMLLGLSLARFGERAAMDFVCRVKLLMKDELWQQIAIGAPNGPFKMHPLKQKLFGSGGGSDAKDGKANVSVPELRGDTLVIAALDLYHNFAVLLDRLEGPPKDRFDATKQWSLKDLDEPSIAKAIQNVKDNMLMFG